MVAVTLQAGAPEPKFVERTVWCYAHADWELLKAQLDTQDWSRLEHLEPDEGAEWLTTTILKHAKAAIPQRVIKENKSSHPWLSTSVLSKIKAKQAAAGTARELEATLACSRSILQAFHDYVDLTRKELLDLKRRAFAEGKPSGGFRLIHTRNNTYFSNAVDTLTTG